MNLEQSIALELRADFDLETLLNNDEDQDLEKLPILLIGGIEANLKTKIYQEFAPYFLNHLSKSAMKTSKRQEKK